MSTKLLFSLSCNFLLASVIALSTMSCGNDKSNNNAPAGQSPYQGTGMEEEPEKKEEPQQDHKKGIGEIKEVKISDPLDKAMIKEGQMIYDMKCASCHKLSDEKVVGPGWAGITNRRTPEWIMNMITNTDMMLEKDPQAQALLEQCLVRMPSQNVSVTDARSVLEFMRDNDMKTVKSKDQAAKQK